jgi:hypothetical protein
MPECRRSLHAPGEPPPPGNPKAAADEGACRLRLHSGNRPFTPLRSVAHTRRWRWFDSPTNAPLYSSQQAEKVGMRREGRRRENSWRDGAWGDTYLYAILEWEWRTMTGQ